MKIGFIDKYLDEWHANNLPIWLRDETDVEAIYAYEMMPSPNEGGISGKEWAEKFDATLCDTIEEVIEKSDYLIVLAPNFPETHEELSDLPLKSGKPTYVDKTFAPDAETAKRIIEKAKKYNTPMFSTSALRYAKEHAGISNENIATMSSRGPGPLGMYSIHQIEPIVKFMGTEPEAVMFMGDVDNPGYVVRFKGNRWATAQHFDWECPFNISIKYSDDKPAAYITECTEFFPGFVTELVKFFKTGEIPVDYNETLAVIAIREAVIKAKDTPGEWVNVNM